MNESIQPGGGGGMDFRNFSQFFTIFRVFCNLQFFRNCFVLGHPACLLVPCVSPVQRCCFSRRCAYGTAVFPQFSRNFMQFFPVISRNFPCLDLTLPDRNPTPPPPPCSVVAVVVRGQAKVAEVAGLCYVQFVFWAVHAGSGREMQKWNGTHGLRHASERRRRFAAEPWRLVAISHRPLQRLFS